MAQIGTNMAKIAKKKAAVPVKALRTIAKTTGSGKVLSVQTARQLERRYKVIEMRKDGCSILEIANRLQCSTETIGKDLEEVFANTAESILDSAPVARAVEIERYMGLLKRYQPLADAGNLHAAGLCLSISDRLRKMLALDKPEEKSSGEETAIRIYVGIDMDAV